MKIQSNLITPIPQIADRINLMGKYHAAYKATVDMIYRAYNVGAEEDNKRGDEMMTIAVGDAKRASNRASHIYAGILSHHDIIKAVEEVSRIVGHVFNKT